MKLCPTCDRCFEDLSNTCPYDDAHLLGAGEGTRIIVKKYTLEKLLGKDHLETTYSARQIRTNDRVILRVFLSEPITNAGAMKRLRRETLDIAHLNARIDNEYVAKTLDYGSLADGSAYVVTEFFQGETLDVTLRAGHTISMSEAVEMALQIGEGLRAAHRCGVVHFSLRPYVISTLYGTGVYPDLKISDFGFAKIRRQLSTDLFQEDDNDQYLSPEFRQGLKADSRSDIYSFGVILFELLLGRRPSGVLSGAHIELRQALQRLIEDDEATSNQASLLLRLIPEMLEEKPSARLASIYGALQVLHSIRTPGHCPGPVTVSGAPPEIGEIHALPETSAPVQVSPPSTFFMGVSEQDKGEELGQESSNDLRPLAFPQRLEPGAIALEAMRQGLPLDGKSQPVPGIDSAVQTATSAEASEGSQELARITSPSSEMEPKRNRSLRVALASAILLGSICFCWFLLHRPLRVGPEPAGAASVEPDTNPRRAANQVAQDSSATPEPLPPTGSPGTSAETGSSRGEAEERGSSGGPNQGGPALNSKLNAAVPMPPIRDFVRILPGQGASPNNAVIPTPVRPSQNDCSLTTDQERLKIRPGGQAAIVVRAPTGAQAASVAFSTPDWRDIAVFPENSGAGAARKYTVVSVSRKPGSFAVSFKSRCGLKRVDVTVE